LGSLVNEMEEWNMTGKDEDFEYDEVRGAHGKKPKMALLNKKKISSYELDELFLDF
jgi:hypothetical protein